MGALSMSIPIFHPLGGGAKKEVFRSSGFPILFSKI